MCDAFVWMITRSGELGNWSLAAAQWVSIRQWKMTRRRERTNRFPTIPVANPEDRRLKWPRRLGISWARVDAEEVLRRQVSLGRGPAIYWICVDELAGGELGKCVAQIVRYGTRRIRRCCSRGAVATSGLALLGGVPEAAAAEYQATEQGIAAGDVGR